MRDGIRAGGPVADQFARAYLAYLVLVWGAPAILLGRLAAGGTVGQ